MMYKNNFVAVIKNRGKILRERNGVVYLPFGSSYSVLLKNKDARRASVTIEVDGEDVLNGHSLILNGNETHEVRGFMRNMSKTNRFKFIKKTKEIQNYRGDRIDDGLVRVTYRFEKPASHFPIKPLPKRWEKIDWPDGRPRKGTGHPDWHYYSDSTTSRGPQSGTTNTFYNAVNFDTVKCSAPLSDEGITVKGEKITQNYEYGDIGTLGSPTTIVLQLRGSTSKKKKITKAVTTKTRLRCSTCGRRNKSTNRYCYNCGTYLL